MRAGAASALLMLAAGLAAGCSAAAAPPPPPALSGQGQAVLPSAPAPGREVLSETGSTLLYQLLRTWAAAYHQQFSQVSIPTAGTSSGVGISSATEGKVTIGASDAYLSSGDLVTNPALLNIPLAISAQQVNYNLPDIGSGTHLKLTGSVLAAMYTGAIRTWNAPQIRALNPGVRLPGLPVVPLHRAQGSGDTFLFSSYLATSDAGWNSRIGYGTTVAWPAVPGALAEASNADMVTGCHQTPGCVAYIGISYLSQALGLHLGEAELANAAGRFELPTQASIGAAAGSFVSLLPVNETISMVNGPARNGYPIVNYEYAIVSRRQRSAAVARDLQAFLHWAITAGNANTFLGQVRFQRLPPAAVTLADAQIASIR